MDIDGLIQQAETDQGLPPGLLRAVLTQESGLNPNAVNATTGATGIGQLMPATARSLGVSDRTDAAQSIPAVAAYLKQGLDKFSGDVPSALKYYYGGPDQRLWGPKTQAYPGQVLRHLVSAGPSQDPNSYLGIPPEAAPAALADVGSRFGNYLTDTLKNAAAQFPEYKGDTPQDILKNAAKANPENFNKLFSLATGFSGGGLTFGGAKAATANLNTGKQAIDILGDLRSSEVASSPLNKEAWEKTGWFAGPDGILRFEIPDQGATLKAGDALNVRSISYDKNGVKSTKPEDQLVSLKSSAALGRPIYLNDILDHPQLFEAYPNLSALEVRPTGIFDSLRGLHGAMDSSKGILYVGSQNPQEFMKTVLHEVQHHIQYLEDFARGGNQNEFLPANFNDKYQPLLKENQDIVDELRANGVNQFTLKSALEKIARGEDDKLYPFERDVIAKAPKDLLRRWLDNGQALRPLMAMKNEAFQKYLHLAGEVESRNVEERYAMRATGFPLSTPGYPTGQQIILRNDEAAPRLAPVQHNPWLAPVEHNPFLAPVEHDPFGGLD